MTASKTSTIKQIASSPEQGCELSVNRCHTLVVFKASSPPTDLKLSHACEFSTLSPSSFLG
jgi:hypothetical protein